MTIVFTVYSQLILRWQVSEAGSAPADNLEKINYIFKLLLRPWVITGIVSTFMAGISWMLTMTKYEISYAYPFVSLNYIFILLFGIIMFNESMSFYKLVGSVLVVIGIVIIGKG
jgi:drug/metabolite transporter (DMT)-like permease